MIYTEKLLLVDDDRELLKVYKQIFEINGFNIEAVADPTEALKIVNNSKVAVVISDIIMPKMDGMLLLEKIKEASPVTEVIMLTAEGSVGGAVEAVHKGAFTYLVKPAIIDDLLRNVGNNMKIREIREKISTVAPTDIFVIITGESGTGKEIAANLIHNQSKRNQKPFIKVNCAALTESLLESELFGHEKGAFTGAEKARHGRFELANHGTLLLDEIGELSMNTQGKLLRVLQEKEFERVGGSSTIKTDFRLITSTNKDLIAAVEKGGFRQDLFYRINVFQLDMPPLRERKDDIPLLLEYFYEKSLIEMKKAKHPAPGEVMEALQDYDWPGNVRELKNIIERMVVLSEDGKIRIEDIPEQVRTKKLWEISNAYQGSDTTLADARGGFEREFILRALDKTGWNITKAANELGIARKNLYRKMKEYKIQS
ncbi:MAG TPA: sigma-54 dependent transcriptional regulator [Bacillota bacterium]|nr:sigma-54 dependent transcriptional regulator [Bacillota bacterium]